MATMHICNNSKKSQKLEIRHVKFSVERINNW